MAGLLDEARAGRGRLVLCTTVIVLVTVLAVVLMLRPGPRPIEATG